MHPDRKDPIYCVLRSKLRRSERALKDFCSLMSDVSSPKLHLELDFEPTPLQNLIAKYLYVLIILVSK